MKMKKMMTLVLAGVMSLSLIGCGSGNKTSSGGSEIKTAYSNGGPFEFFETPWLNPGSYTYSKVLYDHLIAADENLKPAGGQLAKDYSLSEDGKVLVFNLRDDIYWHDGEKITPEDIKWSIEYSLKTAVLNAVFSSTFKAINGCDAYLAGTAKSIDGIVIDGNKITITFNKVVPDALLTFTQFAPLPKKYFTEVDPLKFQQASISKIQLDQVHSKVSEVKMNDYTTLVPFDKYYNGVANFNISFNSKPWR